MSKLEVLVIKKKEFPRGFGSFLGEAYRAPDPPPPQMFGLTTKHPQIEQLRAIETQSSNKNSGRGKHVGENLGIVCLAGFFKLKKGI